MLKFALKITLEYLKLKHAGKGPFFSYREINKTLEEFPGKI